MVDSVMVGVEDWGPLSPKLIVKHTAVEAPRIGGGKHGIQ